MYKRIGVRMVLTLTALIFLLCSVTGVYATWSFSQNSTVSIQEKLFATFFPWNGSELLPDQEGEDHSWLINNLISGDIGLNAKGSYLNQQIEARWKVGYDGVPRRDTLGSMAVSNEEQLEELFGAKAKNLTFLIQFVDDNNDGSIDYYYFYTTNVDLGERGESGWRGLKIVNTVPGKPTVPIGESVYPVYRTKVELNSFGVWAATETKKGYATSSWYDENQRDSYKNVTQIPSFSPSSWVEGNIDS